jgi:hypothetical protein
MLAREAALWAQPSPLGSLGIYSLVIARVAGRPSLKVTDQHQRQGCCEHNDDNRKPSRRVALVEVVVVGTRLCWRLLIAPSP